MIQFLTLFLGLFSGPHVVELRVAEPVAAVEVLLDGGVVGTIGAAPWELEIDFGSDLEPHQLVAVALDAAGREIDRTRRWVNVAVDTGTGDGDEERTAVAVVLAPETELPAVEAMQSWFVSAAGEPLRVVAVEQGAAEVVVVRDPAVQPFLEVLSEVILNDAPEETPAGKGQALRNAFVLAAGTRLRFISPRAVAPSTTSGPRNVFGISASRSVNEGLLRFLDRLEDTGFPSRLSDAVAIAGLELHAGARRRAVVLLTHGHSIDESLYAPAQVREYLRRLQVPVFVWSIGAETPLEAWGGGHYLGPGPKFRPSMPEPFIAAMAELQWHLGRQRMVYVGGLHRPQDVRLRLGDIAPPEGDKEMIAPEGLRLAGSRPPPAVAAATEAGRGKGRTR